MTKVFVIGQPLSSDNSQLGSAHFSLFQNVQLNIEMTCTSLIFYFEADSLKTKAIHGCKLLKFPKIPHSWGPWIYSLVQQRNCILNAIQCSKDLMNFPNISPPEKTACALKHQSDSVTLLCVCVCVCVFCYLFLYFVLFSFLSLKSPGFKHYLQNLPFLRKNNTISFYK